MIDLKLIRDNPSFLDEALKKRGQDEISATVLMLDKENREIIKELQTIKTGFALFKLLSQAPSVYSDGWIGIF